MKKNNIFVYGTLRNNFSNHNFLNQALFIGKATTQGKFVMHCSGQIPFVSEGQAISTIVGEVYEVDQDTLQNIDRLEGCYPSSANPSVFYSQSWYTRKKVSIILNHESSAEADLNQTESQETANAPRVMEVWMYLNERERMYPIIPTGDFADREQFHFRSDRLWYFAYGSNMNAQQMLDRKAFFTQRLRGEVNHHCLVFNKRANDPAKGGFANIIAEFGSRVNGVLYEINADGKAVLDHYEGVRGFQYEPITMPVNTDDGRTIEALVYVAHPSKITDGLSPTADYTANLYAGLEVLGEGARVDLDVAITEARVTNDVRFLDGSEIPEPTKEQYDEDVRKYALPVLINNHKAKLYYYECTWSSRLVIYSDPAEIPYFESLGLRFDELGFIGTKYFMFHRRGILQIRDHRFIVELDPQP